jgi:hypothetical protein
VATQVPLHSPGTPDLDLKKKGKQENMMFGVMLVLVFVFAE